MYYVVTKITENMTKDPEKEQIEQQRLKAVANLRRLEIANDEDNVEEYSGKAGNIKRRPQKEELTLDQYESQIAMEVVAPEDIAVGFEGVFLNQVIIWSLC
jgi:hypothetical protein